MECNKYTLIATNNQGATVRFGGDTKKDVIEQFDFEYKRSGFKIVLYNNYTGFISTLKLSYR